MVQVDVSAMAMVQVWRITLLRVRVQSRKVVDSFDSGRTKTRKSWTA